MTAALPDYLSYPDPGWPQAFARIAAVLDALPLPRPYRIEHVGSTSIPEMVAKPIIDLDLVVSDAGLAQFLPVLGEAGWEHSGDGGLPGRECFAVKAGSRAAQLPRHHLYVVAESSKELAKHRLFRDFLRAHPARAAWLSQAKLHLARDLRLERAQYLNAKESAVAQIMAEAQLWTSERPVRSNG